MNFAPIIIIIQMVIAFPFVKESIALIQIMIIVIFALRIDVYLVKIMYYIGGVNAIVLLNAHQLMLA